MAMNSQNPSKTLKLFISGWPNWIPAKATSAAKIISILFLLPSVFLAPISFAQVQTLTTEKIIQQAEYLFNGKIISIKSAADPQFYQIRLLQSSANIILIQADKKTGRMIELKPTGTKTRDK